MSAAQTAIANALSGVKETDSTKAEDTSKKVAADAKAGADTASLSGLLGGSKRSNHA